MNKNNLSDEEKIQDLIARYDFKRFDVLCRKDKGGGWTRKCMVLINKKDSGKRRYVRWTLDPDGSEDWEVFPPNPSPPKECEGIQRKRTAYIGATLKILQEKFFQNKCKAPAEGSSQSQCQRCGGDLYREEEHQKGKGEMYRLVCFGKPKGYCQYMTDWRCSNPETTD